MPLNDTQLKALKAQSKPFSIADGLGLSVLVQPTGSKWWRFRYRFNGKDKTLSFGVYPDVSLQEARSKRDAARKLNASNKDPSEIKKVEKLERAENQKFTFKYFAQLWLVHWRGDKTKRHADYTERRLTDNVYPLIGDKLINAITPQDIAAVMRLIADRNAFEMARRAKHTISQIFRYAIANDKRRTGRVDRNPANDFNLSDVIPTRPTNNYARLEIKELPAFLRKIDNSEANQITRIATKLMAYTFVRTSELIHAEWAEVDFEAAEWRITPERMKMKTPHIVPLAPQTIELLRTLHELTGNTLYLFPNRNDHKKCMSNNTILKAIERMGYKGVMTGHGFRGIASTSLHERGYDHHHIELQLAHSPRDEVSAAYNHALYIPQRKTMMQQWADYLDELKAGAKIISLHEKQA